MARGLKRKVALRTGAVLAITLAVSWMHLGVAAWVADLLASYQADPPGMQRIEVAYVREMAFAVPVPRPVPAAAHRKRTHRLPAAAAPPSASAVSSPLPALAASSSAFESVEDTSVASPSPASHPEIVASASAADLPASSVAAAFQWPVSTRLRYLLSGHVRGEVHGQAQVEWIRAGPRYQVHLDVQVGPSFAPLAARRMSSEGEITGEGLAPRRYEQETRLAFDGPYRATMRFEADRMWLANGASLQPPAGVQDTASQFVQLAYLFDREPERLRVGASIEVPLAMPRNVSVWTYDVVKEELLHTPFGEVPSFHLKPRREPHAGGDLVTELWIAPQLRHLPIRFVIRQDAENYVDLMLDRRPELAAPEPPARTPP